MSLRRLTWAYPVGHENIHMQVNLVNGYYQPVSDRPSNYRDGYVLDLPAAEGGLYALLGGEAVFQATPLGATTVINRLTLKSTRTLDEISDEKAKGGMTQVFSDLSMSGIRPQNILYDNIDTSSLRTKLGNLIQNDYNSVSIGHAIHAQSIVNTRWQTSGSTKALPLHQILKNAAQTSANDYTTLKGSFLDQVIDNALPFLLPPASNFASASISGAPAGFRRVRLAAQDVYNQYYNIAVLIDVLLQNSNKIDLNETGITCLSDASQGANLYGNPLLTNLGLDANMSPKNVVLDNVNNTRDVVIDKRLLGVLPDEYHKEISSIVQWRYNPMNNFIFQVQIPTGKDTIEVKDYKITKKVAGRPSHRTDDVIFHIRDTRSLPHFPYETFIVPTASSASSLISKAQSFYNRFSVLIKDIGFYLGVPGELLIAVVAHESANGGFPIRFEAAIEYKNSSKTSVYTFLQHTRAISPSMATFVSKYQLLTGSKGLTVYPNNDLSSSTSRDEKIQDSIPLTWKSYLENLDALADTQKNFSEDDIRRYSVGYLIGRVSPGVAQTLLPTAMTAIRKLKRFVERQYGANSPVISKLFLNNLPPEDKPSQQFLWLLDQRNSLVAGAAVLLGASGSSKWDIPLMSSYYNDSGTISKEYSGTQEPNPWGYLLHDSGYCRNVALVYNYMRNNSNYSFTSILKADTSLY